MTQKPPSLEVVSTPTDPNKNAERRRLPRLALSGEQFRLDRLNKVFAVTDLSLDGMALRILDNADFHFFPVTTVLQGTLKLRDHKYPLTATVRHLGQDKIGCQFSELRPEVRDALRNFLDPAVLGQELKPIPSADMGTLWYCGPSGTDLLLWRGRDGQYQKLALFVLGSLIQWEAEGGVKTGRVQSSDENSEIRGIIRYETMLLEMDATPDANKLNVAKTLLLSSNLPQDLRKWCVRQLG